MHSSPSSDVFQIVLWPAVIPAARQWGIQSVKTVLLQQKAENVSQVFNFWIKASSIIETN